MGVLIAFLAAVALVLGVSSPAVASPGTGQAVRIKPVQSSGSRGVLKINNTLGYGWCIDLGFPNPDMRPALYKNLTTAYKLTHVAKIQETYGAAQEVPLAGRRD